MRAETSIGRDSGLRRGHESTIRVDGLGFLGLDARLTQSRCVTMIALTQVRGSQVSMGAEGGSNALSTGNGRALHRTSVTLLARSARGFRGVELVGAKRVRGLKTRDFTPARHAC